MTKTVMARFGVVCATALLLGMPGAHAQEGVAIKNMLGSIGLIPSDKDPIRYRERAPLVLPPKMELREPAGAESFASNNPQWPRDPDIVAKRRQAAEQRIPVTESEIRRMADNNPRLTIDEIRAGRTANYDPKLEAPRHKSDRDGVWVHPDELRKGARSEEERDAASGWTTRRTLADPPTQLRQSARGGPVVAGSSGPRVDQQERDANPMNWLTRAFNSNDDE
ncbi:MAG: hypothetical protein JWR08_1369 [Enterovirga sp.]|jgi:hypothetical protein|nr:hypothetical protein [Enterovirga sp.]